LAELGLTASNAFIVQLFFILRVWKLSGQKYTITLLLTVLSMASMGGLVGFTVKLSHGPTFTRLAGLKSLANSAGILAATCDVAIAVILIYFLLLSRNGFARSDTIIKKFILFTLTTGLLTSLCTLPAIIALSLAPTKLIYSLFFLNLSKLYTNSLFATLNVRDAIHECTPFRTDDSGRREGWPCALHTPITCYICKKVLVVRPGPVIIAKGPTLDLPKVRI